MNIHRPTRRRAFTLLQAAALIGALLHDAAQAAPPINVSLLVKGVAEPGPAAIPTVQSPCGGACLYVYTSSTGMANTYATTISFPPPSDKKAYQLQPEPFTVGTWPPVFGSIVPGIDSVSETLAVAPPSVPNTTQDGGSIGVHQRSMVKYDWQPIAGGVRQLSAQTWKTGNGASAVSYAIRLKPTSSKATYLEFSVPQLTRSLQYAGYIGGPSGEEPINVKPRRSQTRSTVDIYVDGLPVWSSESNLLIPQRFNMSAMQPFQVQWDPPPHNGTVTLFLGTLSTGEERTIAMAIRSELRVEAPNCYNDSNSWGQVWQRCHSQLEAQSLPSHIGADSNYQKFRPNFRVYTSTTTQ